MEDSTACGSHQLFKKGSGAFDYRLCVCDEAQNYVFDQQKGYGCKLCADGQVAQNGKCVTADADMADAGPAQADAASAHEPSGVGESCSTNQDCSTYDAKYCAQGMCLVNDCASGDNACGSQATCCDYTVLSLCLPNDELADGACPMGGMKVEL